MPVRVCMAPIVVAVVAIGAIWSFDDVEVAPRV
jgi:hypothetical protein